MPAMINRLFVITVFLFSILACQKSADSSQQNDVAETKTDSENLVALEEGTPEKNAFAEFSVSKGNAVIPLRSWRKDIPMNKLGSPKDTTVEVLGHGSDTHMGASIHTYDYEDIQLQFYGPKDGTDNWLLNIEVTGGDWSTARGIHVGDRVEDLKTLYPRASNELSGDKNLYRYNVDESTIEFSVKDDKISGIVIRYDIP